MFSQRSGLWSFLGEFWLGTGQDGFDATSFCRVAFLLWLKSLYNLFALSIVAVESTGPLKILIVEKLNFECKKIIFPRELQLQSWQRDLYSVGNFLK